MDNLRGLQGIRRIDKVLNAQIKQLCGVMKGIDIKIDKGCSLMVWPCGEEKEQDC